MSHAMWMQLVPMSTVQRITGSWPRWLMLRYRPQDGALPQIQRAHTFRSLVPIRVSMNVRGSLYIRSNMRALLVCAEIPIHPPRFLSFFVSEKASKDRSGLHKYGASPFSRRSFFFTQCGSAPSARSGGRT